MAEWTKRGKRRKNKREKQRERGKRLRGIKNLSSAPKQPQQPRMGQSKTRCKELRVLSHECQWPNHCCLSRCVSRKLDQSQECRTWFGPLLRDAAIALSSLTLYTTSPFPARGLAKGKAFPKSVCFEMTTIRGSFISCRKRIIVSSVLLWFNCSHWRIRNKSFRALWWSGN